MVQGINVPFSPAHRTRKRRNVLSQGCFNVILFQILRRPNEEEKVLIVCRQRPGHYCSTTYTVVIIMLWDGVDQLLADEVYDKCTKLIPTNGEATERRCGTNEE